jgi:multiple antibiotic resistance protein
MGIDDTLKHFITVFAIVDPIGAVIFFMAFTANLSPAERRKTAFVAPMTMAITLGVAVLAGEKVLWFFGISIHSFKVGGGTLLLLTSIAMLWGHSPWVRSTHDERKESEEMQNVAVVPLGIPLLAGPGAITTVVIGAQEAKNAASVGVLMGVILAVAVITLLLFLQADRISKLLGKTGTNIFTRLLGLILASVSVEIIAKGIKGLFPLLG